MPWTTNQYCTRDEVKRLLDLQSDKQNDLIDELIAEAQDTIDGFLGYRFQTIDETRTFDGTDQDYIMVGDIVSLTSATLNGNDITANVKIGPYNRSPGFKLVHLTDVFAYGRANVVIAATWGNPDIPRWAQRITSRLVIHWKKMQDTNFADTISEQGAVRQKYFKPIPQDVREILDFHSRRLFKARS